MQPSPWADTVKPCDPRGRCSMDGMLSAARTRRKARAPGAKEPDKLLRSRPRRRPLPIPASGKPDTRCRNGEHQPHEPIRPYITTARRLAAEMEASVGETTGESLPVTNSFAVRWL